MLYHESFLPGMSDKVTHPSAVNMARPKYKFSHQTPKDERMVARLAEYGCDARNGAATRMPKNMTAIVIVEIRA
jgi:hypothetical protein